MRSRCETRQMEAVAHGVLFYASLYVNGILLITGITTGRWIFVLMILLTLALTAYLMYLISSNPGHLEKAGKWAEANISIHLDKLKRFL